MAEDTHICKDHKKTCKGSAGANTASGIYGLAFLGALVYYLQHADSFMSGLMGLLKALIWPAMLTYRILQFLNM